MNSDLRPFLRLQTDAYLSALKEKLAEALLSNALETSVSLNGKSSGKTVHVPVADLAEQLPQVLEERGLVEHGAVSDFQPRMTVVRFGCG